VTLIGAAAPGGGGAPTGAGEVEADGGPAVANDVAVAAVEAVVGAIDVDGAAPVVVVIVDEVATIEVAEDTAVADPSSSLLPPHATRSMPSVAAAAMRRQFIGTRSERGRSRIGC